MADNFVVFDIETKDSFADVGGYEAAKLSVSLVGAYIAKDDRFLTFTEDALDQLWPLFEQADRIIGFNTLGFDYPVLQKYYHGKFSDFDSLDIMAEFKKDHGFRIKLDSLAQSTLGVGKSGDGLQAIRLWQQGKIEELKAYCLDDVRLTRDLFLAGRDQGELYYDDRGVRTPWKVKWIRPEGTKPTTVALPF